MKNILVVCVGNICRSPTAEILLKSKLSGHKIWSAGLSALVGYPADPEAVKVMGSHGFDLTSHRAIQLSGWMCQMADIILTMELSHKQAIENNYPLTRGKVFRLSEMARSDIADPYKKGTDAFLTAFLEISKSVDEWVPRIQKLSV